MSDIIRILIAMHKPSDYVHDDIFLPVQVGAALSAHRIPDIAYDDNGDNISGLNGQYCELTAQYWAWKNLNADYYGLFHYRRYLNFGKTEGKKDNWGNYTVERLKHDEIERYGWCKENISSLIRQYDVILPEMKNIKKMLGMGQNMREQYVSDGYLHAQDLKIMEQVIEERYPEYVPDMESYLSGCMTCFNNMFVMKREIFMHYSEWLFDILNECRKRISFENYSAEATRTPGHLAERLLNIYMFHLARKRNVQIGYFPTIRFEKNDVIPELRPASTEHNIAIALAANNHFVPYVSVLLHSIAVNSSEENYYDVLLFHRDITIGNQEILVAEFKQYHNLSIRFVDISSYDDVFLKLPVKWHFSIETYFRLMIPELLQHYDKILYLDADMVVTSDVAELYQEDIAGYLLAACKDPDTMGLYNGWQEDKKEYMDHVLKIKDPYSYFQAGVLLMNLQELRQQYSTKDLLTIATEYEWQLLDQDVLNKVAQGKVKFVDMKWNVMYDWRGKRVREIISKAPVWIQKEYLQARKNATIIHYAGDVKPWQDMTCDFGWVFWKYARESAYYENLVSNVIKHVNTSNIKKTYYVEQIRPKLLILFNALFPRYSARRQYIRKMWNAVTKR